MLHVTDRPIHTVTAYPNNPRRISDTAIEKVAASLRAYGWQQPIVVDRDGVVIVGHVRLAAAQRLGMATVPVHVADDLTPAQVRAYRLADNRTHDEAQWDDSGLQAELRALLDEPIDLASLTGFDPAELDHRLDQVAASIDEILPATLAEQGALDTLEPNTTCPACGHRFHA